MLPAASGAAPSDTVITTSLSSLASAIGKNPHIIGSVWFASSAIFTTYSTNTYLKYHNDAAAKQIPRRKSFAGYFSPTRLTPSNALTLWRFFGSLCLGLLFCPDGFDILARLQQTIKLSSSFALPALFLFVANLSNSIALERIGISLTYTSKCGIPLMTVLLTAILDGISSLPSNAALLSLIPIAMGIAGASWSSPAFETLGFIAAMVSTISQSCLNVVSKRVILKTGVSGIVAQRCMVAVGLVIAILSNAALYRSKDDGDEVQQQQQRPVWLTAAAVLAYHIEYVLSFTFVQLVQPVTYGCSDAVRRLAIILSGRCMFGSERPLTRLNVVGIALALLGALGYSIASAAR